MRARRLAMGFLVGVALLASPALADSGTHHGTFSLAPNGKSLPIFFNFTSTIISTVVTICTEHGNAPLIQSVGASFTPTEPCETALLLVTPSSGITLSVQQGHSSGTYQVTVPIVPAK